MSAICASISHAQESYMHGDSNLALRDAESREAENHTLYKEVLDTVPEPHYVLTSAAWVRIPSRTVKSK